MNDDIRKWAEARVAEHARIGPLQGVGYWDALVDLAPLVEAAREVVDYYDDEDTHAIHALAAALRELKVPGVECGP